MDVCYGHRSGGNDMQDDLIYRQVAIDAFLTELTKRERKNLLHTWSTVEVKYFVVDMLEKLPSAQPEQHWIPCSERLPEASERMPYKRGEVSSEWVLVSMVDCGRPDDEVVKIGRYSYEPRLWPDDGKARGWVVANGQYGKVTAWLPLPAPYKEDTE